MLPGVLLNYLGQGALILSDHAEHITQPVLPDRADWGQMPMVLLATLATIIASQAVITGSFSVASQAMQLGFLPRLKILHTSSSRARSTSVINWFLCVGVVALVLMFESSTKLAEIYGVAVTGTFILNTMLFLRRAGDLEDAAVAAGAAVGAVPDGRGVVLQPRT